MLEVGHVAPEFELRDQLGRVHRLSDQRGSWVVLYFYPKDDTPGCTVEACEFRDSMEQIAAVGGRVFGMSADDESSHQEFASKHSLNFPLLVDPGMEVINKYGAYGERISRGVSSMGVRRVTYLIDPDGVVARVWPEVNPQGHAFEVRQAIEGLRAGA